MTSRLDNPLIVQGDHTVLVEVDSPRYLEARDRLLGFAELVKSPEHVHTYRITPLSIWNACAAGIDPDQMTQVLEEYAKYPVPGHVLMEIRDYATRYGRLRLVRDGDNGLVMICDDSDDLLSEEISRHKTISPLLQDRIASDRFRIDPAQRGRLKQALIKIGFPAQDMAGYTEGQSLPIELRDQTTNGNPFALRSYQNEAVDAFHAGGSQLGGSGVIVLPCGAGKTIVGIGAMARVQTSTLILTTGVTAANQWVNELLDKTTLEPDQIGQYNGLTKQVRPVTVATYQILTHRSAKDHQYVHLDLFDQGHWGLIIYDEVHLLPAPVFQITASLQARRRLGLTATLVREDKREDDVFALIGPKKAEVPWKVLENQGWIAKARCTEVRVPMSHERRMDYALADNRSKFRVASENPRKLSVVKDLLDRHRHEPTLVIGMYVDQLKILARDLGAPLLTGATSQRKRDQLFGDFRSGRLGVLVVSKVANFAIDLPDASVAIQVSGTFGSRQEEAQRLGRILRPKKPANGPQEDGGQAHFYSIVTRETVEQDFALKRQLFLCEQGYTYRIVDLEQHAEYGLAAITTEPTTEPVSQQQAEPLIVSPFV